MKRKSAKSICSICHSVICCGTSIGTGDGSMKDGGSFAHADCYRAHKPKMTFCDAMTILAARFMSGSVLLVSLGTYRRLREEMGLSSVDPGFYTIEITDKRGSLHRVMGCEDCDDSTVASVQIQDVRTQLPELILAWHPEFAAKVRG